MISGTQKTKPMKNRFKVYIALSMLPLSHLAPIDHEREPLAQKIALANFIFQKERVTEYSYPINSRQSVSVDNRYGKITTHNWAKSEVKVIVTVRTAENS